MPIRKVERKAVAPPPDARHRTGDYTVVQTRPHPYQPIQAQAAAILPAHSGELPQISSRDLDYFFRTAASLYHQSPAVPSIAELHSPVSARGSTSASTMSLAPPAYDSMQHNSPSSTPAILVLRLFRQTRSNIQPIAERFHLGPADRQPLYALTAQPSIRSATELNELAIKRRDPLSGAWQPVCTADIEPSLELARHGSWRAATLMLGGVAVWHKVVAGAVVAEMVDGAGGQQGLGSKLYLHWGDRQTLGALGDAYGLWWASGPVDGQAEAFLVVEQWKGLDSPAQGLVRIKPPTKDVYGRYINPRDVVPDLAVLYFHPGGKTAAQLVCTDAAAHVRLDILMAALMTVLVLETRKVAVIKSMGSLPAYDSSAFHQHQVIARGPDYYE